MRSIHRIWETLGGRSERLVRRKAWDLSATSDAAQQVIQGRQQHVQSVEQPDTFVGQVVAAFGQQP